MRCTCTCTCTHTRGACPHLPGVRAGRDDIQAAWVDQAGVHAESDTAVGGGRGDAPRHAGGYAHPEEDVSLQDERESVDTDELIGGSPGAGYYRRMKHEEIRGQRRRAGAVTQARSQAVMQSMLGRRGVGAGGGGKAGGGAAQQQQAGNYRGDVRWPGQ